MESKRLEKLFAAVVASLAVIAAVFLPGTQPLEVTNLSGPSNCGCHQNVDENTEPFYNWQGSMMAQAARDPLFYGQLDISNYDFPGVGDLCLRCHTPMGWLGGRSEPPDGSAMTGDDFEGVFCDFCHHFVDPLSAEGNSLITGDTVVTTYGTGQYVITDGSQARRGPYKYLHGEALPKHNWQYSHFHRTGEMCGVCHDVSNPTNCPPGVSFDSQECFPVERTYSEWNNSWYATQGEYGSCQYCHMPYRSGKAAKQGDPRDVSLYDGDTDQFVPVHEFVGGNTWAQHAVIDLWGGDVNAAALVDGASNGHLMLQSASTVEAYDMTDSSAGLISVRVINRAGHKLPSGYPEGRRMWINLKGYDASDALVFESAAYDGDSAILSHDAQAKIYEIKPGIMGPGGCEPSFHFVLNNCIEKDNRIPPRGFTNAAFDADRCAPVNYTYADGQYWDDTAYTLPLDVARVEVNLYYQTASLEYVSFLSTAPGSSVRGQDLLNTYNATGKSSPALMESVTLVVDGDTDGLGDAWEVSYWGDTITQDGAGNPDGDGCDNITEYQGGYDPTVNDCGVCPDNDGDGHDDQACGGDDYCDSDINNWTASGCAGCADGDTDTYYTGCDAYVTINGPDCDDGSSVVYPGAPELCDGVDNQCPGDPGYGSTDEGCAADTDGDGIEDSIETSGCTDPANPDSDGDGLCDGNVSFGSTCSAGEDTNVDGIKDPAETDPCSADTDGDGLDDGTEVSGGIDPLSWDTDGDDMPDGFEVANQSGHTLNLNALDPSDGDTADFDGDGNPNVHEYWNGSDPWAINPVGGEACFYWGDAGAGDGALLASDVADAVNEIAGIGGNYSNVIPPSKDVQEMSADGAMTATDAGILRSMIVNQTIGVLNSRPNSLSVVYAPGSTVAVGSTTHVTVALGNEGGEHTAGFGIIFSIDTLSSTGSATLLGGDGEASSATGRYDVTGLVAEGGQATIVLRINAPGAIYLDAWSPECPGGGVNIGRYSPALSIPQLLITAE